MFVINDDNSIYVNRGDALVVGVELEAINGIPQSFQPGDVVRMKVYGKKNPSHVVFQKDVRVVGKEFTNEEEEAEYYKSVSIYISSEETKFDGLISKPKDYWYEVELNPEGDTTQTIIGFDEDGAKVFKIFPEGADITKEGEDE